MMEVKPIKTEHDYAKALAEIEKLFDANPETPASDRLEAYENHNYAIPLPDPVEAIKYYLESRGLTRKELELYLGSRARVSEILNRKRPLSLNMIRRLHDGLGIPAEVLIQSYEMLQPAF
jgi:HTH-type transcriptional regulator/antitoxin HigA